MIRENKASYVGSFAILENMLKVTKKYYYECLFWPCSRIATELDVIGSRQTLSDLLALFGKTRFGFSTAVEGSLFGIIGITDVMRLYYDDKIATTMVAGDVAEKGISTEHDTPLTDVLHKLFELRIRRLFVGGEDATFVSDREIVSFMFSPSNLIRTRDSPESLLDASIGEIPSVKAEMVESDMPLAEVALRILYSQGLCIMCDKGLVSPWDTVMKPFALGRLRMPS